MREEPLGVEVEACERREGAKRETPLNRGVGSFALSSRLWTHLASGRGESKRATSTLEKSSGFFCVCWRPSTTSSMGAPPPDSHTKTDMDKNGTTSPSHQQQQAPPPANMVSNSSSPASAPQRGRACNHPNCGRRGFDRCTWGQPQPPGTGTRAPNPPRVGSWRGGRGGGGRGGTNGQNGHAQSMQPPAATATATTATAPAATGGPVVETVKKEDVGTQPQPQLKASDSATSSDEEFGASQISARMQAQTSSLAQKFLQRPAAPSGEWNLDRFQPVKFGESPGALQGSTHSQSVQTPQTPALTTPTSVGGPVTDTHKKNDTNEQPQPKASNPAPATTTKFSAFDGLDGKQYSSKAPELSPNASQAASNINSSVPNGGSGTVAVGAKEINDNHGTQSRPPGLPGMSVPACKTSVSTPGAPNGSDPALETRPATDPSQDEQSVQTAPVGAQASSATAQSAEGPTKRGQDTENKTESDMAPRQHDPAMSATSSSFAFGNPLSQKQPAMAFGAPPAQNTSFSSSPGLGAIRPSFSASFSRGATVGPESGTTTRNPITFGSTQPLLSPIVKRFDVKGEGSSHGRASEPPPALKERARESQGPPRKRYANNHFIQR